ncbi:MAG TPA: DUF1214 domain-containing protein [Pseudomonadales bacterium]|nr:DUF1214 domain-containing protein [Pseudomonadales bacterium]
MSSDPLQKAWQRLLEGLKQAGETVEAQLAGQTLEQRADAYRAVLRAFSANLGKLEADGRFPQPLHVNPPHQKWFIDNPDGITLHCPLDDGARYRLWGNLGAACYTSFTFYEGKGDGLATRATACLTDCEIPVQPDGSFELIISAEPSSAPGHVQLQRGTGQLWIRQLFEAIDRDAPGWFMIENLAPAELPPAVNVQALGEGIKRLGKAVPMLTQMMFMAARMQFENHPPNSVRVWSEMQNGAFFTSNDIDYFIGSWRLQPGQKLIVRGKKPVCRHWNMVLYSPVLNSLEHRYRHTSLTSSQLQTDVDGGYEVCISPHPAAGDKNWLDTEGRPQGLFVIRVTAAETSCELPEAMLEECDA